MQNFRSELKSQYHAALAMLREAIERCPDEEWLSRDHKNAFWQVAYHVLFFTHLYLQPNEAAFVLWSQNRGANAGRAGERHPISKVRRVDSPGTRCQSSSINWSTSATSSIMARSWPPDSARRPISASNG